MLRRPWSCWGSLPPIRGARASLQVSIKNCLHRFREVADGVEGLLREFLLKCSVPASDPSQDPAAFSIAVTAIFVDPQAANPSPLLKAAQGAVDGD
jgi:hypothetical protein